MIVKEAIRAVRAAKLVYVSVCLTTEDATYVLARKGDVLARLRDLAPETETTIHTGVDDPTAVYVN